MGFGSQRNPLFGMVLRGITEVVPTTFCQFRAVLTHWTVAGGRRRWSAFVAMRGLIYKQSYANYKPWTPSSAVCRC